MEGLLGWSAYDRLPPRFQLLWVRTVEPDRAADLPGAIHVWIEELDAENLPSGVPRAYRVPYTRALARKAEAARLEIMKGNPQGGRALDFGAGGAEAPDGPVIATRRGAEAGGDPMSGDLIDPGFLGGGSQGLELIPLPPPRLPRKEAP
jgi:hypothetical protein